MAYSVTPAVQQVEKTLRLPLGTFINKNYRSVFDIIRTSRKQFIVDNMSWLGLRGGKAWDLAMGQAQHIRRLFRENQLTRQIRQGLPQALSGTDQGNIQGLVQNGPTWQNQFDENWEAYCQSNAPEAVDSPVSYLTWLYQQALSFEQDTLASSTADKVIALAERRPDLATLIVDDKAINQQIPALQLVNEILENSITPSLPKGQSVDLTLAETRYPNLLPYHFPHEQVELSLQSAGVPLEEIISQTATDWPWFLNDSWRGERSDNSTELAGRLAPEQQTLVTEADNSAASDLTNFYNTNFGIEAENYVCFEHMPIFTRQLNITVPQLEKLIAGNTGGTCVVVSENIQDTQYAASSAYYGATVINNNVTPPIDVNNIDKSADSLRFLYGAESVDGAFGQGMLLDSTTGQSAFLPYDVFNDMTQDVTLGFWLKLSSDIPVNALLACNTEGNSLQAPGVTLSVNSYNGKVMHLNISDGENSLNNSNFYMYLKFDEWHYFALAYSSRDKIITFYQGGWGIDFDVSKMTSLSSGANSFWFNGNPDEMYYQAYPECKCQVSYDDITIWNRCLTEDDITTIINSTVPVAQIPQVSDYVENCDFENLILSPAINNLSDARMDRINRMVRLQRWLGLSYEETDLLLSACIHAQGKNNTDYSLNAHTLRALGVFRHWQQKYNVTAFEFAAVLDVITPYAISPAVPFFDQVFNAPLLFDAPFAITGADFSYTDLAEDSARTVRQICAGLNITQAQFRVLADKVAAEQGDAEKKTLSLTLAVVSALYRLVMVPRWLGLTFAEWAALLSLVGEGDTAWVTLAGVPQLSALTDGQPESGDILDLLMTLEAAAAWAADHKLSWVKNYLALEPKTATACSSDLLFSHTSLADGKFSQGIQVRSAANSYFYFHPDGEVAQAMKGDKSFTLGFWTSRNNLSADRIPLFGNAGDANYSNYAPGFNICTYDGATTLLCSIADNANKNVSNGWDIWLDIDKWYFIALSWNAEIRKGEWYTVVDKSTVSAPTYTLDASSLSDVTTAEGFTWAFNTRGDLTRHSQPQDDVPTFIYEDIALFDGALSADDINVLVNSDKPVAETDLSGLSATCLWTLSLQPEIDALVATTTTVNFVNGIKQQLPAALLSEQSFATVPLPAGSDVSGWLAVFPYLIDTDGLVLAAAADYDTIITMVTTSIDTADIIFATDADREQAISTLAGIINQARLTQDDIADSALAQMFGTAQSLSTFLLSWTGDSEYRLLADSLAMNSGAALTDPSQVSASYLTKLFAVGQRAGISTAFTLTPATLSLFLAHPDWFGVSNTTLTLTLLYRLSRYADWLGIASDEDRVLGYLAWVNDTTTPDATQAAETLALLLDWESSEVVDATAALPDELAKTVADVDYVMRLRTLSMETGLSVTPLLATGELAPGRVTETWGAWQAAGESLVAAQSGQQ